MWFPRPHWWGKRRKIQAHGPVILLHTVEQQETRPQNTKVEDKNWLSKVALWPPRVHATTTTTPHLIHTDTTQDKSIASAQPLFYRCGKHHDQSILQQKVFNHLGFQGFRVHDGGEKDLTLLPTITGKRGRGKNGERAKEKEREGIGHYRSLWKPQSLTPSDTPHPFQTISPAGYQAFKCVSLDWRDGSAVKGWVHKQIHEPLGAVLIQTTTSVIWVTSFLLSLPSHS